MLKRDEEEILKILLKLYQEQNSAKISGSFTDFPVKYQIVYKEILMRLQDQDFITDFEDFIAEDFVLTLLPSAIKYFDNKQYQESITTNVSSASSSTSTASKMKFASNQTAETTIAELEALISLNGSSDTDELIEIAEEIKEFCLNLKKSPTVQPRKFLLGKIKKLSLKYPWLTEKITKALGLAMMEIMAGN